MPPKNHSKQNTSSIPDVPDVPVEDSFLFKGTGEKEAPPPRLLAQSIVEGTSYPVEPKKHIKNNEVKKLLSWQEAENMSWQETNYQPAIKIARGQILSGDSVALEETTEVSKRQLIKEIFCMAHLGFSETSSTHIDHSDAVASFRQNQKALLNFLNKNADYAEVFLKEPGISELFRRDPLEKINSEDSASPFKIKGTEYFYRKCYNDQGNLWLLCAGCNVKKNKKPFAEWILTQQAFSEKFQKALEAAGGIRQTPILKRIYEGEFPDEKFLTGIPGVREVEVHVGKSKGLAEFAIEWFIKEHKEAFENFCTYYRDHYQKIRQLVTSIIEYDVKGQESEKTKALQELQDWMLANKCLAKGFALYAKARRENPLLSLDTAAVESILATNTLLSLESGYYSRSIKTSIERKYGESSPETETIKKALDKALNYRESKDFRNPRIQLKSDGLMAASQKINAFLEISEAPSVKETVKKIRQIIKEELDIQIQKDLIFTEALNHTDSSLAINDPESAQPSPKPISSEIPTPDKSNLKKFVNSWEEHNEEELKKILEISKKEFLDKEGKIFQKKAQNYNLTLEDVPGDGNCFFHALLDQLTLRAPTILAEIQADSRAPITHQDLRSRAVNQLLEALTTGQLEASIVQKIDTYVDNMSQDRTWADGVIISMMARALGVTLVLINSTGDALTTISEGNSRAILYLGYQTGVHFQSARGTPSEYLQRYVERHASRVPERLSDVHTLPSLLSTEELSESKSSLKRVQEDEDIKSSPKKSRISPISQDWTERALHHSFFSEEYDADDEFSGDESESQSPKRDKKDSWIEKTSCSKRDFKKSKTSPDSDNKEAGSFLK